MTTLSILHFNDVYRVTPQKLSPSSAGTFDVTQFSALLDDLRNSPGWGENGLTLFSGDVFSPSLESSVTRGSHMVPVMNQLGVDVSLTGNHDFDFGYPHLSKLVDDTAFPWILSNIADRATSRPPKPFNEFVVFDRAGVRVGIIGLVEKEWIATVASWPSNFVFKSMAETGIELSRLLRDPNGEYKCDIIIALTHCRVPNDIALAKDLLALSPAAQQTTHLHDQHGVDLILGGHDHLYYVSRGVTTWDNYDLTQTVLGAELDLGDILVVKSGSDFRDFSELKLVLQRTPQGSVRNQVICEIAGKRHTVEADTRSSKAMTNLLKTLLSSVSSTLKAPVCKAAVTLDLRSYYIRTAESPAANWFADVVRHAYDDALCVGGCGGADGVLICAGTLRGDSTYGPGPITLGDILEILPFEDPILVVELDGATLWDAIESSLGMWPAQEGRFPVVSGLRISWDSRRQPGERVIGIWSLLEGENGHNNENGVHLNLEPVLRVKGGRKYKIVTREYMADGHDGYEALRGSRQLIDHESGDLMSSIVRRYLLGSHFVNKMIRLKDHSQLIQSRTKAAISQELSRRNKVQEQLKEPTKAKKQWERAINMVIYRTKSHYCDQLAVCSAEHMSSVDAYDGNSARKGQENIYQPQEGDEDLLVISPTIDDRLKDEARD